MEVSKSVFEPILPASNKLQLMLGVNMQPSDKVEYTNIDNSKNMAYHIE